MVNPLWYAVPCRMVGLASRLRVVVIVENTVNQSLSYHSKFDELLAFMSRKLRSFYFYATEIAFKSTQGFWNLRWEGGEGRIYKGILECTVEWWEERGRWDLRFSHIMYSGKALKVKLSSGRG